jgi:hypothetical protein
MAQLRDLPAVLSRGELIQMLDKHKKTILLVLIAAGILVGGAFLWMGSGIALAGTAPQVNSPLVIIGALVLLAALGMVVLLCFCQAGVDRALQTRGASAASTFDNWEKKTMLLLIVLGVLTVGGTFVWVGSGIRLAGAGPELTLPLVVIVGVVVLLVTLALVAVTFSTLNMADSKQALGLPEGSVRAVIALMLLLVFAIAAIFLYSNVASSGKLRIAEKLNTDAVIELRKHVTVLFTIPPFVEPPVAAPPLAGTTAPPPAGTTAPPPAGTAAPAADAPKYTAYFREVSSPAGDDIAKQLIVLLGTLVTAVASFYFGSSSVASAREAADRARSGPGGPNATNVSPAALKADGTSQPLTITGDNLGNVNAVKLVSGDGKTIPCDPGSVKASATSVTCNVTVKTNATPGPCDVVLSDNANNSSTVPKGVSINPATPQTAAVGPPKPEPTELDQTALKADAIAHSLTISGTNLENVNKVELKSEDGKTSILADVGSVNPSAKAVTCTVKVPAGTPAGSYNVFVSDNANNEVPVPNKVIAIST